MCDNLTCRCCPGKESVNGAVYFSAWQTGTLFNNELNGGLVFQNYNNSKGFCFQNNTVTIFSSGAYVIRYNIYVPSGVTLNTTFSLQADGINIPSSVIKVNHTASDSAAVYTAQAIIEVGCMPVGIRLSSSEIINYSTVDASTLANLEIYKIGD